MTDRSPLIRIMAWCPSPPSKGFRVRQLLWALVHVDHTEPKASIYAVNRAGYGVRLFSVETKEEADAKLERVGRELRDLGLSAFCERYTVPLSFVESLTPPQSVTGLRRFQPLL